MSKQEVIRCPHCQAELAVPAGAAQCLCWSCQGTVALARPPASTAQPPRTTDHPSSQSDDDDDWEIVDVKKEHHQVLLLAGFACWILAVGLWLAPGVPAWLWIPLFAAAFTLNMGALFPKRTRLGVVALIITLLSLASVITPRLIVWQRTRPTQASTLTVVADQSTVAQWDRIYNEIAALRARRVRALASNILDRVRAGAPRLQWRTIGEKTEPVVQFNLANLSRHTLTDVRFLATVTAPDPSDPLLEDEFIHTLPSPLAPGERLGVLVTPDIFLPLASTPFQGRLDLTLTLNTVNAKTTEGQWLIDPFTEADAARLEALEKELESLP